MLPFPIFILVLFSVTLLAPTPTLLIGFIRNATLQSSVWNTLSASIKSSGSVPHPEAAPLLPALFSEVTLDAVPTRCGPSRMHVAPNNTIPHSFVDGRITCAAVLLVVSLAMFNCLVYKLFSNGKHDAEGSSQSLMSSSCLTLAASPFQESIHGQKVNVLAPLLLSIDTSKSITGSFEPERLPRAVTAPPFSSFEVAVLSSPSAPLKQPVPFLQVLTREFSIDDSEKETDSDLSPASLLASDDTLVDPSSDSVAQSTGPETLSASPILSAVEIDDSKPDLPQNTLDSEAEKGDSTTLPLLDASDIPHPPEQEPVNELHNYGMSPPAVKDTSELDADGNGVFHYQPSVSESCDEETFDYQGMDWTEEIPESPPALATEDQARSPHLSSRLNDQCPVPSLSVETPTPDVVDSCKLSLWSLLPSDVTPRWVAGYASDDIQIGLKDKGEGKSACVIRYSSADDLSSKFKAAKTAHALIINDEDLLDHTGIPPRDNDDTRTAHNQVTILRAVAPVFEPLSSGTDEAVLHPELSSVGLKSSIHAPRDEISQTEGCAGVSESVHATRPACAPATTSETARDSPEPSSKDGGFQASSEEPKSSKDTTTGISNLPDVTNGIHASIHTPQTSSTTSYEVRDGATGTWGQTTPARPRSNSSPTEKSTQSGLSASIHARRASEDVQPTTTHTADAPNWAAAAREQDSSISPGSSILVERSNSPSAALVEDAPELELQLPTTTTTSTRCAANDQQQQDGSVDNSDRLSDDAADDQDEDGTTSTGQTDNELDEADDSATSEQLEGSESATPPPPPQSETRSRGKKSSRRSRHKVPYLPPPRMRDPNVPPFHVLATQMHAPTPNAVAASSGHYHRHTPPHPPLPAASSGQYYGRTPPPPPPPPLLHRPNSTPYPMVSPNGCIPNRLEQHPPPYHHPQYLGLPHRPEQHSPYYQPQHIGSPSHMAASYPPPVPGFQPPGPYYPTGYFHPQFSPQAPLYGR